MNLGRKQKVGQPQVESPQVEPPKPRTTKLERLQAQLEKQETYAARLTADRAAIDAKEPELAALELELRREGARKGVRSDAKGALSESTKVARDRKEAQDRIPALEAELAAAAIEIQATREQLDQALFQEALAGVEAFDERELEIVEGLGQVLAALYEGFDAWQALCAARRDYPSGFSLSTQGMVNQLQAALQPKWDPPPRTPIEALERLIVDARKAAEPSVNVVSEFDLHQLEPAGWEMSEHLARIQDRRNHGAAQDWATRQEREARELAAAKKT